MSMAPEEYQWHIKLVVARHESLNLTYEQAEKVFAYEQEKDTYSNKYFFTLWEDADYEYSAFREILSEEQFKIYEIELRKRIQFNEQSFIEQDNEMKMDIKTHNELLEFYETKFIPDFFKDPFLLHFGPFIADHAKVKYIREEYKQYLNDRKKEILTNHFRNNRTFRPNLLMISLIQHKLSAILPDYLPFKARVDLPTKAMLDHLVARIKNPPETTRVFLNRKFNELREFNQKGYTKNAGEIPGWHTEIRRPTPEEEMELQGMTLLLMDKDRYGF